MTQLGDLATAEDRAFTPDEQNKFDAWDSEAKALENQINTQERIERSRAMSAVHTESPTVQRGTSNDLVADHKLAFRAWMLKQGGKDLAHCITPNMYRAADRVGFDIKSDSVLLRTSSGQFESTATAGGDLVNSEMVEGIVVAQKQYTSIQGVLHQSNH